MVPLLHKGVAAERLIKRYTQTLAHIEPVVPQHTLCSVFHSALARLLRKLGSKVKPSPRDGDRHI